MDHEQIAKEAIAEAWHILGLLANAHNNPAWSRNSVPQNKLDRLAQQLGYKTAQAIAEEAQWERDSHRWADGPGPFP
jgi:hypothetical protein